MYIAHVSTSINLNQTIFNQMIYQQKCGHRVVALCTDDEWAIPLKEMGIQIIDVPLIRHDPIANLTSALVKLWMVCRREKFDVVHTHTLLPGIVGRIAARLAGVPVVVHTFHTWPLHLRRSWPFIWAFNFLEFLASHAAHAMLFQNRDDLHSWKRIPGIPTKKATLVGNGIDSANVISRTSPDSRKRIREEFGIDDDNHVLVKVARFEPQKGHQFLLEVLKHLTAEFDEKIVALLVGLGEEQEKIETEVERLGLENVVRFTGYRLDVPDILAASDVSVMTSHFEGIPRALMESMILGLPVVATDVPGTRELVRHGKTGFLVEYGDPIGWTESLICLLASPKLAAEFGRNGKERVQNYFDEYVVADRVERVYKHILGNLPEPLPRWDFVNESMPLVNPS